jgi:hypothetical protein
MKGKDIIFQKNLINTIIDFLDNPENINTVSNLKVNVEKAYINKDVDELDSMEAQFVNWLRQLPQAEIERAAIHLKDVLNINLYNYAFYENKEFKSVFEKGKILNNQEYLLIKLYVLNIPEDARKDEVYRKAIQMLKEFDRKIVERRAKNLKSSAKDELIHLKNYLDELLLLIMKEYAEDSLSFKVLNSFKINCQIEFEKLNLKGLVAIKNDIMEMLRELPVEKLNELDSKLLSKTGQSYFQHRNSQKKKITSILKKGKIISDEEYRSVEEYVQKISTEGEMNDELIKLNKLLGDYSDDISD